MTNFLINKACIIDDDKLYVTLIDRIIKKNNLAKELIVFENGQQALAYFQQSLHSNSDLLPEVILLDLNMPVMDGWEFLNAIEPYYKDLSSKSVRLNVVSSTINPSEVAKAKSHAIVSDFLTKPISKEAMTRAFTPLK